MTGIGVLSRPVTIALLLCLAGFGIGAGVARVTDDSSTEGDKTTARTTVTTDRVAAPKILLKAAPLPGLAAAERKHKTKTTTTPVTPPSITPPPVTPPAPVTPPPPPPPPPTEIAPPLGGN